VGIQAGVLGGQGQGLGQDHAGLLRRGKGAITVSAFAEDGVCVVRIADDGPGIPPRLAARLFEPFVSSKQSEGTGLGLTISRELAALHGGDLRLVEAAEVGAVFELRLPA
ncbi:ATP-binding protein, partial [Brevundimonas sp.]|uniref:ATP-binding protein n=1 Tax=Brevundimonas sp. TaxID=1871086 RepID=UPI0019C66CBB